MGIVQCTYCSQMHHCCRTLCQSHYTKKKTRNKNWCKNLRDGISRGRQHTIYSREKLYNARTSFNQDKYKFCLLNFRQKQFCRSIKNGDNQYIIFKIIIIIKFTNDILSNDNNNWWEKTKHLTLCLSSCNQCWQFSVHSRRILQFYTQNFLNLR